MITAKEARELSGPTIQEEALSLDPHIRKAAENKERKVLVYHGKLENEAYSNTQRWKDFVKYMQGLGFKVSLHYNESQFVDMRLRIEW